MQLHMSNYQNEDLQSIKSNLQPNARLKGDFQKKWTHIQEASG